MNYSHQIAEKFAMSENKVVPKGRGESNLYTFYRGHRPGVLYAKIGVQTVKS